MARLLQGATWLQHMGACFYHGRRFAVEFMAAGRFAGCSQKATVQRPQKAPTRRPQGDRKATAKGDRAAPEARA
jgi:hypothetical protein